MSNDNSNAKSAENSSGEGSTETTDYLSTFEDGALSEDDAMEALLGTSSEDAEKPSKDKGEKDAPKSEEAEDETPADEEDEDEDEDDLEDDEDEDQDEDDKDSEDDDEDDDEDDAEEDDDEDEEDSTLKVAEDDAVVEVKVDGEVSKVPVSELKRLAGQEAKLTQKSQAVSQKAKEATAQSDFALDVIGKLYDASKDRLKRYEGIDLVELAQSGNYSKEDLNQVRSDMEEAAQEVSFFEQGLKGFVSEQTKAKQEILKREATEAVETIADVTSEFHIDEFEKRYPSILEHGRKRGIPEEFLQETPAPWLWKLLADSETASTVTKRLEETTEGKTTKKRKPKTEKSGKTVLKSKSAQRSKKAGKRNPKSKQLVDKAISTGSEDDALAALMSL